MWQSAGLKRILTLLVLLWSVGEPLTFGHDGVQPAVTKEEILQIWKKREARTGTAEFIWTEINMRPRGSVLDPTFTVSPVFNPKGLTIPEQDITFESSSTVKIDGEKMSFSYTSRVWSPETGESTDQEYISVFDGKESKIFRPKGAMRFPTGAVLKEMRNTISNNLHVKPVLLTYRPLHKTMGIADYSGFQLFREKVTIGDHLCYLMEQQLSPGKAETIGLWIREGPDYAIARYVSKLNGEVYYQGTCLARLYSSCTVLTTNTVA